MESVVGDLKEPTEAEFWKDRSVAITGITGFKGSWLALMLRDLGARVSGFGLEMQKNRDSLFVDANIEGLTNTKIIDARNFGSVYQFFESSRPEIVFHLAAQPIVSESFERPVFTFETNVMGTVNVLESLRSIDSLVSVISVTSDKCYQNNNSGRKFVETDPLGGNDPYSASKACAEIVGNAYRSSYYQDSEVGLASARAGNVIGGGDWSVDRLVPDVICALCKKERLVIRNPHHTRPWQHVLDAIWGYMSLAEKVFEQPKRFGGAWNFGPSYDTPSVSVAQMVEQITSAWGVNEVEHSQDCNQIIYEAAKLNLDCSKAMTKLDWQPVWDGGRAVEQTVDWYKRWHQGECARELCLEQIRNFLRDQRALKGEK